MNVIIFLYLCNSNILLQGFVSIIDASQKKIMIIMTFIQ